MQWILAVIVCLVCVVSHAGELVFLHILPIDQQQALIERYAQDYSVVLQSSLKKSRLTIDTLKSKQPPLYTHIAQKMVRKALSDYRGCSVPADERSVLVPSDAPLHETLSAHMTESLRIVLARMAKIHPGSLELLQQWHDETVHASYKDICEKFPIAILRPEIHHFDDHRTRPDNSCVIL